MAGHYVNHVSFKAHRAFFYRQPVKQTNKKLITDSLKQFRMSLHQPGSKTSNLRTGDWGSRRPRENLKINIPIHS